MVCDGNDCIFVYTKELEYVRQIKDPVHFNDIYDVSPDEHGNLYVCDRGNSCIHVLSNGGEYLRSFGCDGRGVNKLSGPEGIYVSSQYVYVTNDGITIPYQYIPLRVSMWPHLERRVVMKVTLLIQVECVLIKMVFRVCL